MSADLALALRLILAGLAAVFSRGGHSVLASDIETILPSLHPFGREWQSFAQLGPVAFAYSHLSIVPETGDDIQPVLSADRRFAVVLDGRLDNREQLASNLDLANSDLQKTSDARLVLLAWQRWRTAMPGHLDGDYALIAWDAAEQMLFAARDPLGHFPLTYYLDSESLVIATAPECVFAAGGIPRTLDLGKIAEVIGGVEPASGKTVYKYLMRLPPAHALTVKRHSHELSRHWTPDASATEIRFSRDEDYVEAARELLDQAVRRRLRTKGGVASEMSGGLDSSTIAVTALHHLQGQSTLPVYTHVLESGWDGGVVSGRYGDETPLVREVVAMHPRLEPNFVSTDGRSWDEPLNEHFRGGDVTPQVPRFSLHSAIAFADAQKRGVGVMLNGVAGNATLTWDGRGAFLAWLKERRFATLARELHAISPDPLAFVRAVVSRLVVPLGPDWLWRLYVRAKQGQPDARYWQEFTFVNPDFARDTILERSRPVEVRPTRNWREMRMRIIGCGVDAPEAEFSNAARRIYGIDYRDPMKDRHLVEWCLRVPEEQYWRQGTPRWLVRRLMAGQLPASVLGNRKRGMQGADWHAHLTRELPTLREQVDVLSSDPDVAAVIDFPRIKKALSEWPSRSLTEAAGATRYRLQVGLPHALAVGRFIRWSKGANL